MPKHCKWGLCKSDTRYPQNGLQIKFWPFPKPCKDFRLLKADPSLVAIKHEPQHCIQCNKCLQWIKACKVQSLTKLEEINKNCFVCSKHFPNGAPTNDEPHPVPAGTGDRIDRPRKTPTRRLLLPSQSSKRATHIVPLASDGLVVASDGVVAVTNVIPVESHEIVAVTDVVSEAAVAVTDVIPVVSHEVVAVTDVVSVASDDAVGLTDGVSVASDYVVMKMDDVCENDVFTVTDVASQWSPQVVRQATVLFSSLVVSLDHNYAIPNDPAKFTKRLQLTIEELGEKYDCELDAKRRKIKLLQSSVRRKTAKLIATTDLLDDLQKQHFVDAETRMKLAQRFSGLKLSLIINELNNADKTNSRNYSKEVFAFAHTLNFLSPKAYKFACKTFSLPHKSTLRRHQSVKGAPGWTCETFAALHRDPLKSECVVIMDAIHIKSSVQYVHTLQRFVGYEDFGDGAGADDGEMAKEALTFMAVGLNSQPWRAPLGYVFTAKPLTAEQQKELLKEAIVRLFDVQVQVRCIVFDGTYTNQATVELLGAILPESPFFCNPSLTGEVIYCIMDNSHMIKLARNTMAKQDFKDGNGGIISWSYIKALHKLQNCEGLRFANRLTVAHVEEWQRRKMKVKLAVQVLSTSVADALQFLLEQRHPLFVGAGPTIRFIRLMDGLFDRMDSKSPFGLGNKSPITRNNLLEVEAYFLLVEQDLRALTDYKGTPLMCGITKTFIIGYISDMKAAISLAQDLFKSSESHTHLLLHRLSQDPIEHFFGDIRSRGAWCQNPTAHYFMYSYRALVSNQLQLFGLSQGRNCSDPDPVNESNSLLVSVGEDVGVGCEDASVDHDLEAQHWAEIHNKLMDDTPNELRSNILYYMAGWAARQVSRRSKCSVCREALFNATPFQGFLARLTIVKQRGGLLYASRSVYRVIYLSDRALQLEIVRTGGKPPTNNNFFQKLLHTVVQSSMQDRHIFSEVQGHGELLHQHVPKIIKCLAHKFLKARLGHLGKLFTTAKHGAASEKRNQQTRNLIFKGI